MSKSLPPEGAWVSYNVRVREADLARIDAARGDQNRSEWTRALVLAHLSGPAPSPAATGKRKRRPPAVVLREPAPPPAPTAACGHAYPDVRNVAGRVVCRKCGEQ